MEMELLGRISIAFKKYSFEKYGGYRTYEEVRRFEPHN